MSPLPESSAVAREDVGLARSVPDPFFIVGVGRSGTSIMAEVLNQHSDVHVIDESHLWASLGARASGDLTVDDFIEALERVKLTAGAHPDGNLARLFGMTRERVFELVRPADPSQALPLRRILDALLPTVIRERGARRWGEKTPAHLDHVEAICAAYPGAKFIYMVRDGRDVAVSLKRDNWGPKTLIDAAYKWQKAARQARDLGAALGPTRWLTMPYEALVASPEEQVRRAADFLGLSFEPSMLSPSAIDTRSSIGFSPSGRTAQNFSDSFLEWSRAPKSVFFSSSIGSWRALPKVEIDALEALLGAELLANGYELTTTADERTASSARLAITGAADLERRWQKRLEDQERRLEALERMVTDAHADVARALATQAGVLAQLAALSEQGADHGQLLERIRQGLHHELNRLERRQATAFEALERTLAGQGRPANSRKYGDL